MMNPTKRHLLSLAAVALLAAACDPFPAAPEGSPQLVRAIASGIRYVEADGAAVADPTAVVVTDVSEDALLYVQFNKPMDGGTIQALPDYDPVTGATLDNTCDGPTSPIFVAGWPADTTICYMPSSVTDGAQIAITPGDVLAVGSYSVAGDVKDYQGNVIAIDVAFDVTLRPTTIAPDPYNADLRWAFLAGATGYTVEHAAPLADGSAPPADSAAWTIQATNVQYVPFGEDAIFDFTRNLRVEGLAKDSAHYYRVTPEGVTGAVASAPELVDLSHALAVSVGGAFKPTQVELLWSRVRSTTAYRIEKSPADANGDPTGAWTEVVTLSPVPAGGFGGGSNFRTYNDTCVAVGDWVYRVIPIFGAVEREPVGEKFISAPTAITTGCPGT